MLNGEVKGKASFRYGGCSMWPLFQTGDLLVVRDVQAERLRPGDCIVYRKIGEEEYVAHRIVAVKPEIRTKGDATLAIDCEAVSHARIIGKIEGRIRYGRPSRVSGGIVGVWTGRFYRYAGLVEPYRNAKGGKAARYIRRHLGGVAARLVRMAESQTVVSSEIRKLIYLTFCNRTVGIYDEESRHWSIIWPYSLLIDPERLPSAVG